MEGWLTWLGRAFVACLVVTGGYLAVGIVLALVPGIPPDGPDASPWAAFLPAWPVFVLPLAAFVVTCVYSALVLVLRGRKSEAVAAVASEAKAWLDGPVAQAARSSGVGLLAVGGFRAHARDPHTVELSWNTPLDAVDEVYVYRSTSGFAATPQPGDDFALLCRAVEVTYADTALEDERLYLYTAFARGDDGSWSPPSWASATTPRLPLRARIMGSVRTLREGVLDD